MPEAVGIGNVDWCRILDNRFIVERLAIACQLTTAANCGTLTPFCQSFGKVLTSSGFGIGLFAIR